MSASADLRRGWCPTALRPMASGDGLIVRLALPGGILPAATARGIAACARRFGNGFIDLTQRANLQLRGVSETTFPTLIARLEALGLAPSENEPETARAIIASPLPGLDLEAALDIRPVVAALHGSLAAEPALTALPAKFCWLVDDGGRCPLDDVGADIRFVAVRGNESKALFTVALGGRADEAAVIGTCTMADVPHIAIALAHAFLALAGTGPDATRRMRELVARDGAARTVEAMRAHPLPSRERVALAQQEPGEGAVTLGIPPLTSSADADDTLSREGRGKRPAPLIGFHDLGAGKGVLGVGAPFGRLTADQLGTLADTAHLSELRLAPWRAALVPCDARDADRLGARLARAGLVTDPADARFAVVACPGAPACPRGTTRTRDDAVMLAPLARRLGEGITLHVSGCAKSCARGHSTRATLVGRDGRYDLVIDGTADTAPAATALTLDEAAAALLRLTGASDTLARRAPAHLHPVAETAS